MTHEFLTVKPQVKYKDQLLEFKQLQGVVQRSEILLSLVQNDIKQQSILDESVTWEVATKFYNSLDKKTQNMVKKSGQQMEQGWYNPSTKKLDKPGSKPTNERGILVCQMYLQQAACCAYSGDGPYHILDFQVEHIIPEEGDFPYNIVLVLANVNENKKQDMVSFVLRAKKNLAKGEDAYQAEINSRREASSEKSALGKTVMAMSFSELKEYVEVNGCNKYVWRRVGMSSLGEFRVLKNSGQRRAGGSQGNYKAVLDTISREFLFGEKEVAEDLFKTCRLLTASYRNGEIQNDVYAEHICDIIKTSSFVPSGFKPEKLFDQIVNSTYKWPHL